MFVERFLGLRENKQLEKDDLKELAERARNGQPIYGTPSLPFHQQAIAFGNSAYSSQILSLFLMVLFWTFVFISCQISSRGSTLSTTPSMASTRRNTTTRLGVWMVFRRSNPLSLVVFMLYQARKKCTENFNHQHPSCLRCKCLCMTSVRGWRG